MANIVDPGSFVEVGGLIVAAQSSRRSMEDLMLRTPADGMVSGIGSVNASIFGADHSQAVVMAYDFSVLAGTQGFWNHQKSDRMVQLAKQRILPVVWFCEGGGGRPGDTDLNSISSGGLKCPTFLEFGHLSGLVPLVGVASGYCFAGNAAVLGCCDVVIAVEGCNIGMGGPAMIEGGGLGKVSPDAVGPLSIQAANGVVDVVVSDEAEAALVAKQYLSYFQGVLPLEHRSGCTDQRLLRHVVPENRMRAYEMRDVIRGLFDEESFLELRAMFGVGVITGLARLEGRPMGVMANNPKHLGGAIDADAALKASRFLELCDAFDIPLLFLCDCPGFMVGPKSEEDAAVRKMSRMFVTQSSLTVPVMTVVTRKAYGLGAMAMSGGDMMNANAFCVSWPTGEFGGMGLEGAVKLGMSRELAAARKKSPEAEKDLFDRHVAQAYEQGKGLSSGTKFGIDDVIDPADTRRLILSTLQGFPEFGNFPRRREKKRPCIGTW